MVYLCAQKLTYLLLKLGVKGEGSFLHSFQDDTKMNHQALFSFFVCFDLGFGYQAIIKPDVQTAFDVAVQPAFDVAVQTAVDAAVQTAVDANNQLQRLQLD